MNATARVLALLPLAFLAAAAADDPPMDHHVAQNALGTMAYDVYAPPGLSGKVPLFVHLHGANNKTTDAAHRSRLNELAAARGFVAVYPQEDPNHNGGIWSYGTQVTEGRDGRASSLIAQITHEVMASQPIDPKRIFIGGISAGAGSAMVMAAQYPELYSALQIEVGAKYSGSTAAEAGKAVYDVMGPRARRIPLMLSYGTIDPIAKEEDEESVMQSWLIALDWIDDGQANGSVPLTPASTRDGMEGKTYHVDTYVDGNGCVFAERWLIDGMFHAYAGGAQTSMYGPADVVADPNAPNMREKAYDFFIDQLDADGPPGCKRGAALSGQGVMGTGSPDLASLVALLAVGLGRRRARWPS